MSPTTTTLLCEECTVSQPLCSQETKSLRFLTHHISMPEIVDTDAINTLAKSLCFHCEGKGEIASLSDTDSDLHTSNRPLLAAEEEGLSLRRKRAQQQLLVIRAALLAVEKLSKRLQQSEVALKDSVSQYGRFLSPIRRIPKEVLTEIAQFTVAVCDRSGGCLDVGNGIWPLSQVCSSWREVIVNAPTLWSNLNVTDYQPYFSPAILLQCINRSQSVPLNVSFISEETELSRILFQQICSLSHRWRSLQLYIFPCHWDSLDQIRNSLTELQFLSIDIQDADWNDIPLESDLFAFAPKLQTVMLGTDDDSYGAPPLRLQFPMEPISRFELWGSEELLLEIADVIPQSAVEVDLGTHGTPRDLHPVSKVYPLTSRLRIRLEPWLLDLFTCPQLNMLELRRLEINKEFLDDHFAPFVVRSTNTFSTLYLNKVSISSGATIHRLFQITPAITELEVTTSAGTVIGETMGEMMRLLKSLRLTSTESHNVLPQLSTLTLEFQGVNCTKRLYATVFAMVKSRAKPSAGYGGTKLRKFSFIDERIKKTITLNTYHKLKELADSVDDLGNPRGTA